MSPSLRLALALAGLAGLLLALGILYQTPPEENRFAPPCVFHQMTGLHCPGCGSTRAVYALLHLHPQDALRKNALFIVALPFIGFWSARGVVRWVRGETPSSPPLLTRPRVSTTIVSLIFAFAILRNLPWPPFTLLAPG